MIVRKIKENNKEVISFIFMLLAILIVTGLPFLVHGLGCFYADLMYHLLRIESMKDALLNGVFPSRINPMFFGGYGYGSSLFYPDVFLVFPALLRMLGITPLLTWKLFALCITAIASCSTYFAFRYISQNWKFSVAGTFLLMLSQFYLSDLINRAGISEYLAFIFLPLLFVGVYDFFAREGKKIYLIGIAFAGLLLSHTIMTLLGLLITIVTFVIAVFFKTTRKSISDPKKMSKLLITAVLTVLSVSFYIFPMMEQMASGEFQYQNPWTFVGNNTQPFEVFFYATGDFNVIAWIGVGIPILLLLPCRIFLGKTKNRWADVFLVMGILLFLITTKIFPWEHFNETFLNMIQFTYRFYPYALFATVLGIILVLAEKCIANANRICLFAIGLALVFGVWQNWDFAVNDITGAIDEEFVYENSFWVGQGEWLPVSLNQEVRNMSATHKVVFFDGEAQLNQTGYNRYAFEVLEGQDTYILPLIYYKGYTAALCTPDGERTELDVTVSEEGLVQIIKAEVQAGTIEVDYSGTVVQAVSNAITLITILGVLGAGIWKLRKALKETA